MRWLVRLSAVCLVIASSSWAQQSSSPPNRLGKLSARADFVLVPVIVTDKSNNPVSGLTKDAFRLEENGKLRTLTLFEETQTQKLITYRTESSPTTYTNFPPRNEHLRMTIFVIDMLNTPWLGQFEGKRSAGHR